MRIGSPGGRHLVASVPAKCLVALGAEERMMGAITPGGEIIGISFDLAQVVAASPDHMLSMRHRGGNAFVSQPHLQCANQHMPACRRAAILHTCLRLERRPPWRSQYLCWSRCLWPRRTSRRSYRRLLKVRLDMPAASKAQCNVWSTCISLPVLLCLQ